LTFKMNIKTDNTIFIIMILLCVPTTLLGLVSLTWTILEVL
jgi:hypothetical protein